MTLIGAGHVFRIADAIQDAILAIQPDVVFVELDRGRLEALLAKRRGVVLPQPKGMLHRWLAKFQEWAASVYGAQVGEEMLAAVDAAAAVRCKVMLIDPPADATLRRLLKEVTFRERMRFFGQILGAGPRALGHWLWPWGRKKAQEQVEAELKRYQDDPQAMMEELRTSFPTVHRIVIAERDQVMVRGIRRGLTGARHGVAVLGDGHLNGMLPMLADLAPDVYRLPDVREGKLPKPATTSASVSFSLPSDPAPLG